MKIKKIYLDNVMREGLRERETEQERGRVNTNLKERAGGLWRAMLC